MELQTYLHHYCINKLNLETDERIEKKLLAYEK